MTKKLKIVSFALAVMTLFSVFAAVPVSAKTVKKPKKLTIYEIYSLTKGQLIVTIDFDAIGNKNPAGYQLAYSQDKNFKSGVKYFTEKAYKMTKYEHYYSLYVRDLPVGKTYYAKARQYNMDGKNKVYSDWSSVKSVKIAKALKSDIVLEKECSSQTCYAIVCHKCGMPNGTGYNGTCKWWSSGLFGDEKIPAGSKEGCNHYGTRKNTKPSKVTGVKKKNAYKNIRVYWNKIKDVDEYEIQYSTNSKFKNASSTTSAWFKDGCSIDQRQPRGEWDIDNLALKKNTKYYVRVRAIRGNLKGPWSAVVKPVTKITMPHNIKATAGKKKVTIKFSDYYGTSSKVLIKYSTNKNFKNSKYTWTSWGKASKTITGLKSGKTYYFKLKAYHYTNGKKTVDSKSSYSSVVKIKVK